MTVPPLVRSMRHGDRGPDVLALKRALKSAGYGRGLALGAKQGEVFGAAADRQVRRFQKHHGLNPDGVYGPETHKRLGRFYDAYGRVLLSKAPRKTHEQKVYDDLLSYMQLMTRETPGYGWGGGHGPRLSQVSPSQRLDCSSSCSLALHHAGLFPSDYSWVSGTFASSYGDAGPGKMFTVYANYSHVWIRLHVGRFWRFDTSPHGDGGQGPRLRRLPRSMYAFTARHHPGY